MQKSRLALGPQGFRPSPHLVDLSALAGQNGKGEEKSAGLRRLFFASGRGFFAFVRSAWLAISLLFLLRKLWRARPALRLPWPKPKDKPLLPFLPVRRKERQAALRSAPAAKDAAALRRGRRLFAFLKPALGFAAVVSVLVVPFKAWLDLSAASALEGRVVGIAESAVNEAISGGDAAKRLDFQAAAGHFKAAEAALQEAQKEIAWIALSAGLINQVAPSGRTKLAEQASLLLEAGVLGAGLAGSLSRALAEISAAEGQSPADIIKRLDLYLTPIEDANLALAAILREIEPAALPADYRVLAEDAREKGLAMSGALAEAAKLFKAARRILGFEYDTRQLLVFQNNGELRASGGFIGSYALADFHNGEIKRLEVPAGGGYDTEAGLYRLIRSPEPLRLLKPRWYFWDANWWPDWELSAAKLAWFLEQSQGPSVDGVISFTPTFAERLLALCGPITVGGGFDITVDSGNFYELIRSIVEDRSLYPAEGAAEGAGKPKEVIGALFEAMLEQIPARMDRELAFKAVRLVLTGLAEKHILLYFSDPESQQIAKSLDWAGQQAQTRGDYLMVVNTNIGGGKSDRRIADTYELESVIRPDGGIENTLKINRQHLAYKNEPFFGVRNVDWLRVYVPPGARLLEAEGFIRPDEALFKEPADYLEDDPFLAETEGRSELGPGGAKVYAENGKTVFAGWLMLDPGESRTVTLRYRLPFKASAGRGHSLLVQKQPGTAGASLYYGLSMPEGFELAGPDQAPYSVLKPYAFSGALERDQEIILDAPGADNADTAQQADAS